ncbi:MAG: HTH domain-containing protein [Anaerolineae bacterium]|nr:HTH domain-containing protein [Anaerolineae bacterium]
MFGNKQNKGSRLEKIGQIVKRSNGITQADLSRELGVSRGTINKDLSIIQDKTGVRLAEDDNGRLYWSGRDE